MEASTVGRICPRCKTEYPPGVLRCPKDNTSTDENAVISGAHPLAGTFIGSYRIKKLIGAGGMGEVLLGEHPTLGMSVAIKILRQEVSSDAELVSRFFAEAKTIANLKHPNIVEVVDLSVLPDGRAYYVMEHLQGKSLASILSRAKGLRPEDVLPLFRELLSALGVAHQKGVVHRDIKPANIVLLKEPQNGATVKLLDFGIAKLLTQPKSTALSVPGIVLGTPAYMSPEQAMGKTVSPVSDIYSVGVVLFEALTGELPFGDEDDFVVMNAHATQTYPKLSSRRPELAYLDSLLGRFLEKDPNKRFASAAEAIAAIRVAESQSPEDPEEGATVRRAPIQEDPTVEHLKAVSPAPNQEDDDPDATRVARSGPKRLQDNLEVSPSLLPGNNIKPVAEKSFEPTVKLRPLHIDRGPEPIKPPSRGRAPFIALGVVGIFLLGLILLLLLGH